MKRRKNYELNLYKMFDNLLDFMLFSFPLFTSLNYKYAFRDSDSNYTLFHIIYYVIFIYTYIYTIIYNKIIFNIQVV